LLYELLTNIESNISGCGNSKTISKRRRGGVAAAASVMAVLVLVVVHRVSEVKKTVPVLFLE